MSSFHHPKSPKDVLIKKYWHSFAYSPATTSIGESAGSGKYRARSAAGDCGYDDISKFNKEDLTTFDHGMHLLTGIPYSGITA